MGMLIVKIWRITKLDKLREKLQNLEKNKLTELVLELIDTLDDNEKIKFISRNIDSEIAIDAISSGDTLGVVVKIKRFCKECNRGLYYVEDNSYYSFYSEGEDYDSLSNSEWAQKLEEYLEVAAMYSRNKEYDISLDLFKAIFNTISEGESDYEILGTEDPRAYINVDYRDVFNEYIKSIISTSNDESKAIEESLNLYIRFGEECEGGLINNIHNVEVFEKVIRENYMDKSIWTQQALIYNLLIKLYEKGKKEYEKVELAKSFIDYNNNFYVMVIEAYAEVENYEEGIRISEKSLELVSDHWVRKGIINILIDSCMKINDMEKAFKYAKILFSSDSNYENYKKVRSLANDEKIIRDFKKEAIEDFEKIQMDKNKIMESIKLIRITMF